MDKECIMSLYCISTAGIIVGKSRLKILMKRFIILLVLNMGLMNTYAQCTPTYDYASSLNPVCSFQQIGPFGSLHGIVKIPLSPLAPNNLYRFTTVGLSEGDTQLFLFDGTGTQIAENDNNTINDVDTYESLQSTITYTPTTQVMGGYLILAKTGCAPLDFETKLEYNVVNSYDYPYLIENLEDNMCVGSTVTLTVASGGNARNWNSSDPSVATITGTGEVTFWSEGRVEISAETNPFSCVSTKKCKVVAVDTSIITKN